MVISPSIMEFLQPSESSLHCWDEFGCVVSTYREVRGSARVKFGSGNRTIGNGSPFRWHLAQDG